MKGLVPVGFGDFGDGVRIGGGRSWVDADFLGRSELDGGVAPRAGDGSPDEFLVLDEEFSLAGGAGDRKGFKHGNSFVNKPRADPAFGGDGELYYRGRMEKQRVDCGMRGFKSGAATLESRA